MTSHPQATGDLCWFSMNNATIMLNGASSTLVRDDTSGVWHASNDQAWKIEHLTDTSLGNGDDDGEYWKITTQDGTAYYFGRQKRYPSDTSGTSSVQVEPVYGNDPGEPCYNATFANAWCMQAYRWNLDYVVDPRGNSMTFFYTKFSGHYGRNNNQTSTAYDLEANLWRVDYGTRAGVEDTSIVPVHVQFATANRCINTCQQTNADYPDSPWDQYCSSSSTCPNLTSPVFFNPFKLSTVTTQVYSGGSYHTVDQWSLAYTFPSSGDNILPTGDDDTDPNLWLSSVTHAGFGPSGSSTAEPATTFGGTPKYNRVQWGNDLGVAPYVHYRLTSIDTPSGGETVIAYSDPECPNSRTAPADLDQNGLRCFPDHAAAGWDWFHKYVVASVTEKDLTGGSPDEKWTYAYSTASSSTNVLWHFDNNETATLSDRTWSQWAGYSTVTVTHGTTAGSQNVTTSVYFRGMDADRTDTGWNTRAVTLSDSQANGVVDYRALAGMLREQTALDGSAPSSSTIHYPTAAQTASRGAPATDLANQLAFMVTEPKTRARTWVAASSSWRWTESDTTFDSYGLPVDVKNLGDTYLNNDDTCSHTDYARNTATNLVNLASQTMTTDCAAASVTISTAMAGKTWVGSGDFNGDGKVDLLARDAAGNLLRYLNTGGQGSSTFGAPTQVDTGWGDFTIIATGDVNGDGYTDLIGRDDGDLYLHLNNKSNGAWIFDDDGLVNPDWSGMDMIVLGDADDDGRVDIVARQGWDGDLCIYRNTGGTGTAMFADCEIWGEGWQTMPGLIAGLDYDADATMDFLAVDSDGDVRFYPGKEGSGSTVGHLTNPTTSKLLPFGDLTGDGLRDFVVADSTGTVTLYPNTGSSTAPAFTSAATPTVLAGTQTLYDGSATVGATPTQGLATRINTAASASGATITWDQSSRAGYDSYGRVVDSWDALDRKTHTAYTPSAGGAVTSVVVTNPLGWTTTSTIEPVQGVVTRAVDANAKATNATYDNLGRLSSVWLNNRSTSAAPDRHYVYTVSPIGPTSVETDQLGPNGNVLPSFQVYDGRLRPRQTQASAVNEGRLITDTSYDDRGLAAKTFVFYNEDTPQGSMLAFNQADVTNQHRYTYDRLNRATSDQLWSLGSLQFQTTTAYDGDRTTTTPPAGGTATRTLTDAADHVTELDQYLGSTPSGSYRATTYVYDRVGQRTAMTDPAGNMWTTSYDLRGRAFNQTDPDTGSTTMTYDDAGQLLSTTDARPVVVSNKYDNLGRITERWQGAVGTGTKLADFTYDTLAKGQLTYSNRYTGGNTYTTAVTGYDDAYRPLGTTVTVPASEGFGSSGWTSSMSYKVDGSIATIGLPAAGSLSAETLTYDYWDDATIHSVTGLNTYISDAGIDDMNRLIELELGGNGNLHLARIYDDATGRLGTTLAATGVGDWETWAAQLVVDYNYDPAGNVTSKAYTEANGSTSSECFKYDGLRQLAEGWTTTSATCQSTPTLNAVGGPDSYWQSYGYDTIGNRTSQVVHASTGSTTYSYVYPTTHVQPHTLTAVNATGAVTGSSSYIYDAVGNTTTRNRMAQAGQTLTWDAEGHLATVTASGQTTTYIYDANGNRLLAKDANGSTLYLGAFDLHKTATGPVTCTRYYSVQGWNFGTRADNGALTYLSQDNHGTTELTYSAGTETVLARLRTDPFGNIRNANPWPDTHGFIGGNTDATGLTHLGSREFDASTGRFISADQVLNPTDPQQWNGYAYAANNPTTASDPSGDLYQLDDVPAPKPTVTTVNKAAPKAQPKQAPAPTPTSYAIGAGPGKAANTWRHSAAVRAALRVLTEQIKLQGGFVDDSTLLSEFFVLNGGKRGAINGRSDIVWIDLAERELWVWEVKSLGVPSRPSRDGLAAGEVTNYVAKLLLMPEYKNFAVVPGFQMYRSEMEYVAALNQTVTVFKGAGLGSILYNWKDGNQTGRQPQRQPVPVGQPDPVTIGLVALGVICMFATAGVCGVAIGAAGGAAGVLIPATT